MSKRKRNTCVSSGAVIPEDLIEEILLKLPNKSLLRCKSVSKQWLALITSHRFALRHGSLTHFLVLGTPRVCNNKTKSFITPVSICLGSLAIVHSNVIDLPIEPGQQIALLVAAGYGVYCAFYKYCGTVRLWNHVTRECIGSHPPHRPALYGNNTTTREFQFGKVDYEDGNLSYIVGHVGFPISINGDVNPSTFAIELYSSKTKSWKFIPNVCRGDFFCNGSRACVNLNGKAHWIAYSHGGVIVILSFDYETETIRRIKVPCASSRIYHWSKCILSLWDEALLCVVLFWMKGGKWFLNIWIKDESEVEVENSWVLKYTVGPFSEDVQVLGFSSKIHSLFLRPRGSRNTSLLLYDCKTSNVTEFSLLGENMYHRLKIVEHVLK